MSVSDKIRQLDKLDVPRAEIAHLLGKRYQHVRNVLEADKLKQKATRAAEERGRPASSPLTFRAPIRLEVGPDGAIVLPQHMRRELGVDIGGPVVARPTAEGWELIDCRAAAQHARDLVRALNPGGASLVDELMEERRSEAARETDH